MDRLTLYTTKNLSLGKKCIAYAEAVGTKVQVIDFEKTPLTETQLLKCLTDCGAQGVDLVDQAAYHNTDFPVRKATNSDWVKLLVSNTGLLKYPILKVNGIYRLIKSPSEVLK